MRWSVKQQPSIGDIRTRRGFLWFPKLVEGEWRWLEYATWIQEYQRCLDGPCWCSIEWR